MGEPIENAALAAAGGERMEPLMKLIAKINTIFFLSPPSLRQQRQHTGAQRGRVCDVLKFI